MPGSNPILGGKHISSYSSAANVGADEGTATPGPASGRPRAYNVPAVVVVLAMIGVLLLLRALGFAFVASARVASR